MIWHRGKLVGHNNPLPVIVGGMRKVSLLKEATATGAGEAQKTSVYKTLKIEVWGIGTFDVQIEVSAESGTFRPMQIWSVTNNEFVENSTITSSGFYEIDVQGMNEVRANIKTLNGNVNASGVLL